MRKFAEFQEPTVTNAELLAMNESLHGQPEYRAMLRITNRFREKEAREDKGKAKGSGRGRKTPQDPYIIRDSNVIGTGQFYPVEAPFDVQGKVLGEYKNSTYGVIRIDCAWSFTEFGNRQMGTCARTSKLSDRYRIKRRWAMLDPTRAPVYTTCTIPSSYVCGPEVRRGSVYICFGPFRQFCFNCGCEFFIPKGCGARGLVTLVPLWVDEFGKEMEFCDMCKGRIEARNIVWLCHECKGRVCAKCVEEIPMKPKARIRHLQFEERMGLQHRVHLINVDDLVDDSGMWTPSGSGDGTRRLDVAWEMCKCWGLGRWTMCISVLGLSLQLGRSQ